MLVFGVYCKRGITRLIAWLTVISWQWLKLFAVSMQFSSNRHVVKHYINRHRFTVAWCNSVVVQTAVSNN